MNRQAFSRIGKGSQSLRNHGEGAAGAGESAVLGETPELDGALPGAGNFIDRVRDVGIADIGFVGGIVEQDRAMLKCVGHPGFKLPARCNGSGRIVREAEIDDIDLLCRNLRHKSILRRAFQIGDSLVGTILASLTRMSRHDIRIDIDGIDRIHDGDPVVRAQDIKNIAPVALGAVGNEDLIVGNFQSTIPIILLCDRRTKEFIPLLRSVAMESPAGSHLVNGLVHRLTDSGGKRLGHITDPASDQLGGGFRVGIGKGLDPSPDLRKEIAGLELEIVGIERRHKECD